MTSCPGQYISANESSFSEYIWDAVDKWIPAWETLGFTAKDLADGDVRECSAFRLGLADAC